MENQFIRHEPCFERILFVLTLDRKKMKERILIGEEQQIHFLLNIQLSLSETLTPAWHNVMLNKQISTNDRILVLIVIE